MSDQFTFDENEGAMELRAALDEVVRSMKSDVPETVMQRFLKPLKPHSLTDDVATIVCPGRFVYEWVRDRYEDRLRSGLSETLARPVRLDLRMQEREKTSLPKAATTSVTTTVPVSVERQRFQPNPQYTFDSFVKGQSNRLAMAGSLAVAQAPGTKYNPLFIYGSSGLGKTHLLHSIANEILKREPGFPVMYVTAQQFAEDFVSALQNNRIEQFRRIQRSVSVWLVDDIQFIAGKDKTTEEIFHTFNYLHGLGKQIVMCSDRAPRDLLLMDERLRSRLESGLVADVQLPDTETRCAIIQMKAQRENVSLPHNVAMYLAESVPGNIRLLEGALTKMASVASLEGLSLDMDFAKSIVEQYYQGVGTAKPSFDQILKTVGRHFQIPVEDIKGTSRKAPIAHARHVAVFMTREILRDSWKHIGALFGNRDHTSMMHGYKKIREMMNRDKELNAVVKSLMRDLYPDDF